jgi:predicted DNA-binding transcriptional regulator AlpA
MSKATQEPIQRDRSQLIRKRRLLEKVPFSKSTLHAKMIEGGRFHDHTFPRPIYFPNSRIPFWREADVDDWITASECRSQQLTSYDQSLGISGSSMATSTGAQTKFQKMASSVAPIEGDASNSMMTAVGLDGRKIQIPVVVRKKRTRLIHDPRANRTSPVG